LYKKKHSEIDNGILADTSVLIVRANAMKEADLGLTKDGRKRWHRRPKSLVKADKFTTAAALRLKGQTWAQISEILHTPEETCRGWTQNTDYQEAFNRLLAAFKEEQRTAILNYVPDAIRTLHDLLNDRSGHVRYEAAQALIEHANLDKMATEVMTDNDFVTEIERLRKKASSTNVQVNVLSASPAQVQISEPVIDGEVV